MSRDEDVGVVRLINSLQNELFRSATIFSVFFERLECRVAHNRDSLFDVQMRRRLSDNIITTAINVY